MKYADFKYGTQKYGTAASNGVDTRWGFLVDWAGDGVYGGGNEARYMVDFSSMRGRTNFVRPSGNGLERYRPGIVTAVFDNSDGRYDPFNTSSPLYPNVLPGKMVTVMVKDTSDSTRGVMRGKITNIETYRQSDQPMCRITVEDGLQFLNDQIITVGLQGLQMDNLARLEILPAADWPTSGYWAWGVGGNSTTHLVNQWALRNNNALEAMHSLEDGALGQFVHARQGTGYFFAGSYTYDYTVTITEDMCLRDIHIPAPWEVLRNAVTVNVYQKRYIHIVPNPTVFELDTPVFLENGTSVFLDCQFSYESYPTIGQYAHYSFTVNTAADGSGSDLTVYCTLVPDNNPGWGAVVEIINSSGYDGYVTELTITVENVSYVVNQAAVSSEDATSQATYGKRNLLIDSFDMDDFDYAKRVADWLLANLKDPVPWPVIQLENRPIEQFFPYLYQTRIRLQLPSKNIDAYYRIGGIKHDWLNATGQAVRTTFWLEPYFTPFAG